jgi:hypothetical protein
MRVRILMATALVLVGALFVQRVRTKDSGETLAYTECPFRGDARITVTTGIAPEDTFPVRMHEQVHASQCRELGPVRYRLKNLTSTGRLSLEAPAYCAGARARLAQGIDTGALRERLDDDATAAFQGGPDADAVRAALRMSCSDIAR